MSSCTEVSTAHIRALLSSRAGHFLRELFQERLKVISFLFFPFLRMKVFLPMFSLGHRYLLISLFSVPVKFKFVLKSHYLSLFQCSLSTNMCKRNQRDTSHAREKVFKEKERMIQESYQSPHAHIKTTKNWPDFLGFGSKAMLFRKTKQNKEPHLVCLICPGRRQLPCSRNWRHIYPPRHGTVSWLCFVILLGLYWQDRKK